MGYRESHSRALHLWHLELYGWIAVNEIPIKRVLHVSPNHFQEFRRVLGLWFGAMVAASFEQRKMEVDQPVTPERWQ